MDARPAACEVRFASSPKNCCLIGTYVFPLAADSDVAGNPESQRQGSGDHEPRGDFEKLWIVFAMKRKAMQGSRCHQEQYREPDRGKSRRVNPFDRLRQGLEGLRQR